jgi:ketosteroid isomerase-like protein
LKKAILIAVMGLSVALGGASRGDANADAKKAIQSITNQAMTLIIKQDYKSLAKLCTPDCTFTQFGQTMKMDQMVSMMKAQMTQMKDLKMSSTVTSCSVKGKTATCMTHDKSSATLIGADKKPHKMTSSGTSKTVYVKTGGTWLMTSMKTVSEKDTMDGKPFDPSTMANDKTGDTKK